uniref:NADH dehydrogenase [ubiquinone] 1 subunit C2 n=1 Tax=Sciurus vulgaris TaxID=55149 RepID=A0A8D2DM76_SCIVU
MAIYIDIFLPSNPNQIVLIKIDPLKGAGTCSSVIKHVLSISVILAGLHHQLLYVTSSVFAGYYLLKCQDHMYAVRNHDMFAYIKSHPEDFPGKDKILMVKFLKNSIQCIEVFEMFAPIY